MVKLQVMKRGRLENLSKNVIKGNFLPFEDRNAAIKVYGSADPPLNENFNNFSRCHRLAVLDCTYRQSKHI
eukprot:IDg12458t1